ncbi:uncharacterized protein K460DRAFT_407180 [Cucurbitaria berberidis CBS 394.84]|uniref:Uncharacterized protein n=1 Tax=Cucurbitaria berberidis CBS 394.84 TaxID=1168544 RepID=A0A9P4L601_9PLEO|nr:uncharacterized protein K460DRAFT_407180 [Cucurbitaria berberidis CBS 394.84]KAF1842794.1 hypothetical protein K460DRAFT_407180 [Cucurbitaria berberidis CBS 394.84]
MVRLFVPEGEGQHALARRQPGALAAQRKITSLPWKACTVAGGITGFLALVGRSRPGIFLRSVAVVAVLDLSFTACQLYGRRELNRGVFKLDGIEPAPGKLWERTRHWTEEDAALGGAGLGIFTALNPRALPGVFGWKRIIGSAVVGAAFGSLVGERMLPRFPSQLLTVLDSADTMARRTNYDRLHQNEEAKASLSRFGNFALTLYTLPVLHILRSPTAWDAAPRSGMIQRRSQQGTPGPQPTTIQQLQSIVTINVDFEKEELAGPDIEGASRTYTDDLKTRDMEAVEHYLEHLQELKKNTFHEARYVWYQLAKKERVFYDIVEDDDEKDLFRREIQLLSSVAQQLMCREAILAFHIADARKQVRQMDHSGSTAPAAPTLSDPLQSDILIDSEDQHSPQITTNQIRTVWTRQKEILAHLEQAVSHHDTFKLQSGEAADPHLQQLRQDIKYLTKNVEATGRVLREFEEQVRKAEEDAQK